MFLSLVIASAPILLQAARPLPKATPKATPRLEAKAPTPTAPAATVPFGDGETATYNVSWSAMSAGTATLSVKAGRNAFGIESWMARAEANPSAMLSNLYTLKYAAESTFDARTLLPRRGLVDSLEGKRRRIRRTAFDHERRKAQYSVTIGDTVSKTLDITSDAQDVLSVVYKIRTLPLASGFRQTIPVCDNGRCYALEISVVEKASIKTALGAMPAFKVAPRVIGGSAGSDPDQQTLWLSADDRRILLRAESALAVGKVTLEITTLTPGAR